ncbi:MAG: endolytic transglycosylase MltG [Romboutsia sp.]
MDIKNNKWKVIGLTTILAVILIGIFIAIQIGPYNKNNKEDIKVDIPAGSTSSSISNILYENELIKNKALFKVIVKLSNKATHIKAGTYIINQSYSNMNIVDLLASGKVHHTGIKVTIPEGSTSKEIISILEGNKLGVKDNYMELINNPSQFYDKFMFLKQADIISLEGFLYPDTYYIDEKSSEKEILSTMLARFDSLYTDEMTKKEKELNMSLQQIVSLASIVEKEAVLDPDRAIIASVFYNRLKIGMALQSDATIQYIFEERKKIVTYDDLAIDSPYNSYKNKGLPPTPIASPGIKSIKATLNPDTTDYIYFVAKMDGGNNYSKTYEQHLKHVKEYREERDKLNLNEKK